MFFFIGGIQPKKVTLDEARRMCPGCGLAQARLRRVDHYLSLFFIPLFPVSRGKPVLICDRCGTTFSPDQTSQPSPTSMGGSRCSRCGYSLEPGFQYCPQCGSRI